MLKDKALVIVQFGLLIIFICTFIWTLQSNIELRNNKSNLEQTITTSQAALESVQSDLNNEVKKSKNAAENYERQIQKFKLELAGLKQQKTQIITKYEKVYETILNSSDSLNWIFTTELLSKNKRLYREAVR